MRYMPTGGYIEGNSLLHKLDAFVKLLCTFLLLASVIVSDTIVGYVLVIALLTVTVKMSSLGLRNVLRGVKHMWLFFFVIFLMNAVFHETAQPLWSWWIFHFSFEGTLQGFHVVLRVILAMILGNLLVSTTSPLDIVGALETLLFPLKYAGVPIQDVAMILGVAIQFIPTFLEEAAMIKKAQTARGARFESRKITERTQSLLPLIVPIFLSAFRRADELSVAMESRGYHRTKKKGKLRKRHLSLADVSALLLSCLFCIIEIIV